MRLNVLCSTSHMLLDTKTAIHVYKSEFHVMDDEVAQVCVNND